MAILSPIGGYNVVFAVPNIAVLSQIGGYKIIFTLQRFGTRITDVLKVAELSPIGGYKVVLQFLNSSPLPSPFSILRTVHL
ncbi:hypothetical protein FOCC_FOCC003653 [Frankliniella occidentalis]|nr:hypothetical protein FOCC_FOCC003653 [Frankliniella occidentalis]